MKNNIPQFDDVEFAIELKQTNEKYIIVEGPTDKEIIRALICEFQGKDLCKRTTINIDFVKDLELESNRDDIKKNSESQKDFLLEIIYKNRDLSFPGGNRGKVELFHELIVQEPAINESNFICFCDREFKWFKVEIDKKMTISDNQSTRHSNRLVYTQGHSIENYFFDLDIFREKFNDFFNIDNYNTYFRLFKRVFNSTLLIATKLSLIGNFDFYKNLIIKDYYRNVPSTITKDILEIDENLNLVSIDNKKWQSKLAQKNFSKEEIEELLKRKNNLKNEILYDQDLDIIKLFCHAHIGMTCFHEIFLKCLDVSGENKSPEVKKKQMSRRLANCWARRASEGKCNYPIEIFELLDMKID